MVDDRWPIGTKGIGHRPSTTEAWPGHRRWCPVHPPLIDNPAEKTPRRLLLDFAVIPLLHKPFPYSHALRGKAVCDAPRRPDRTACAKDAERFERHSHAERGSEDGQRVGGDPRRVSFIPLLSCWFENVSLASTMDSRSRLHHPGTARPGDTIESGGAGVLLFPATGRDRVGFRSGGRDGVTGRQRGVRRGQALKTRASSSGTGRLVRVVGSIVTRVTTASAASSPSRRRISCFRTKLVRPSRSGRVVMVRTSP